MRRIDDKIRGRFGAVINPVTMMARRKRSEDTGKSIKLGPHSKRLMVWKMAQEAIPDGGGIADGIAFLSNRKALSEKARDAAWWVDQAIKAVRNAADPNPWKSTDDEAIAAEIMRRIDDKIRG